MSAISSKTTWITGIAIFSMFFGAGNVVFPLLLGKMCGDQNSYATIGLLLTAIGGPLLGLFGAMLFQGNFKEFFCRIGTAPGYILMIITSLLLGPFAVMPRCLIVSYAALNSFFPGLSLFSFSILSAAVIFLLVFKKNKLLPILGTTLSPILLICLILIIAISFFGGSETHVEMTPMRALTSGLLVGYDTMDLIASIFFSVSIWSLLKTKLRSEHHPDTRYETKVFLIAGSFAGVLLGLVYIGFSHVASLHIPLLQNVSSENLLTTLAFSSLGSIFGILANLAIGLACLTTIMSLAVTFTEILRNDFKLKKINHPTWIFIIVVLTALFSNLGFSTIMKIIHPAVEICYPAIIILTICNILYKTCNFKMVKLPVYATFAITLFIKGIFVMKAL
ncbi:MAG: Branched-chain amino acid transport system 2 carrier protein [Chlamydiia bacterium]|nr:Branched-chain amino acid transport system 2 carrier protein [Chlamydiia bacterium]